MATGAAGMTASLPSVLALALLALPLLALPGAGAQAAPGIDGPEAAGSAGGENAYVRLLKSGEEYRAMDPEQQEAYVAMANEFITSGGAYEAGRNMLLVELSEVTLQIQATDDERRLEELRARHAYLVGELEEYGVGPESETDADPSYYLDKAEQARERLEVSGATEKARAGDGGPEGGGGTPYDAFLGGLAWLYDAPRAIVLAAMDALAPWLGHPS